MKQFVITLVLLAFGIGVFAATPEDEINALLTEVQNQNGLVFIRNGSEYSASQAADHLRVKWKAGGDRIKSAEEFIIYCGTKASVSGVKYKVRLSNGKEQFADEFLTGVLARLRSHERPRSS